MSTYNRQQLSILATETGFLRDNLEKVIRLTDILHFIEDQDFLCNHLVLKGGTAINLPSTTILTNPFRLSSIVIFEHL